MPNKNGQQLHLIEAWMNNCKEIELHTYGTTDFLSYDSGQM